jgi:hypothetical protein
VHHEGERLAGHTYRLILSRHELVGLRRDEAWKWWFDQYGFARILKYDEKLGAGYYLTKYVTKDLGDIQFGIRLNR